MHRTFLPLALAIALFSGCRHYIPPGPKADLQALAPSDIQAGFATKPSSPFPAAMTAVRLQAPSYSNYYIARNGGRYGEGRYTVITAHEVEDQVQVDRIAKLPSITALISLNRMLLPTRIDSDRDLRLAASRLQADLLLLYTFDTSFFDTDASRPLAVITLGLSPTRKIKASTTASALLMDTRTGYVYAAYETTERRETRSTSWGSSDSAEEARIENEKIAFSKLVDEIVMSWPALLDRFAKKD